jgi:nicotinamidase-related amidase
LQAEFDKFFLLNLYLCLYLQLVVCGQALSHCVNFTVRDIHARVVETGDLAASDMYLLADGE